MPDHPKYDPVTQQRLELYETADSLLREGIVSAVPAWMPYKFADVLADPVKRVRALLHFQDAIRQARVFVDRSDATIKAHPYYSNPDQGWKELGQNVHIATGGYEMG